MSGIKKLESKTDFSVSNNFELSCKSMLTQLQIQLPSQQWLVAYKDQDQWIRLYSHSTIIDTVSADRLSSYFDDIISEVPADIAATDKANDVVGMPLKTKNQIFLGVLCAYKPKATVEQITEQLPLVHLFSKLICYQLESEMLLNQQKYKNQQLLNLSHTDSLTQLLNHRAWSQMLMVEETRAQRYGLSLAIFIVDLDNLKVINDREGHSAGDLLIINTANCLRDICRESDLVARLGGDEFGLLAVECNEVGAQSLLNNIRNALKTASIDASVGYCVMTETLNILDTVHTADKNMYEAKSSRYAAKSSKSPGLSSTEICQ